MTFKSPENVGQQFSPDVVVWFHWVLHHIIKIPRPCCPNLIPLSTLLLTLFKFTFKTFKMPSDSEDTMMKLSPRRFLWQQLGSVFPLSSDRGWNIHVRELSHDKRPPLCISAVQTDRRINIGRTKSPAHDCNIFFGTGPKGEGSAVRTSAAQFDLRWGEPCSWEPL